jgi:hypothetical protein
MYTRDQRRHGENRGRHEHVAHDRLLLALAASLGVSFFGIALTSWRMGWRRVM